MRVILVSSAIIQNGCIGNFGSACQLDGKSVYFERKRPIKEAKASDTDEAIVTDATNKANVAKEACEANKADEAKVDEADEAIVANEAAETDEAYLANKVDVMRPTRPM